MGDRPRSNASRAKLRAKPKLKVEVPKPISLFLITVRRSGDEERHKVAEVPTMHWAKLVRDKLRRMRLVGRG